MISIEGIEINTSIGATNARKGTENVPLRRTTRSTTARQRAQELADSEPLTDLEDLPGPSAAATSAKQRLPVSIASGRPH